MHPGLIFTAEWERLDEGTTEERACFAAVGIQCNGHWLTEGRDGFVNRIRTEPLLSGYHLAEWMAWNWWRLRWEPRSSVHDWVFAHRMTTIGHGYVWPNITIYSDGERTALIARPTEDRSETAFRYISSYAAIVPSQTFENAADRFIEQVVGQLQAEGLNETNLNHVWAEVVNERQDHSVAQRRKLEAILGYDPDEGDQSEIDRLAADALSLGEQAVEELAAEHATGGEFLTADGLRSIAHHSGFAASIRDAVRLETATRLPSARDVPAWRLGAEAARALRAQESLGVGSISDKRLAGLAGTGEQAITTNRAAKGIAFALDQNESRGCVVFKSPRKANRRFELARLLGDRIVNPPYGKLHVATRAVTYRQQMQRSFAAELLSPFEVVDQMMEGDYSSEKREEVAERFFVSELTIRTMLVNHKRLDREELEAA
ncbi:hypothetical protein [Rhodopila sp.]|uniref:hypothetical protein n=1 Tax=Rhodopila sp. TaxID=2480087 RepID=UPI003D0A604D